MISASWWYYFRLPKSEVDMGLVSHSRRCPKSTEITIFFNISSVGRFFYVNLRLIIIFWVCATRCAGTCSKFAENNKLVISAADWFIYCMWLEFHESWRLIVMFRVDWITVLIHWMLINFLESCQVVMIFWMGLNRHGLYKHDKMCHNTIWLISL